MDFQREKILKDILNDETLNSFIKDNNMNIDQVTDNLIPLYSTLLKLKKCANCKGLKECSQDVFGRKPYLKFNRIVDCDTTFCEYYLKTEVSAKKVVNLTTMACNLANVNSKDLFKISERTLIYNKFKEIFVEFSKNRHPKGVYLSGGYGTGKSYIMACFAAKFASNGSKVVFAYLPDLVREIKSSISTGNLENIVDQLKNCDVLFLDDLGGEQTSPFIRDEVLGPVLQDRMTNEKLTFATSNLDKETLHEHLSDSQKGYDELKASRIEERIFALMEYIELKDTHNYRH